MKNLFMRLPKAIKVLCIAMVYFGLAVLSLQLSFKSSNATAVWPPSGFAFAVLLLAGRSVAPGIFIGAFAANLFVFLNNHTASYFTAGWVSVLIALGNTAEALTGNFIINTLLPGVTSKELFKNVYAVFCFVFAALFMCLISSSVGAGATYLAGIISSSDFSPVWFTWWTGDVAGILLVSPLIIVWTVEDWKINKKQRAANRLEAGMIVMGLVVVSTMIFQNLFYPGFLFTRGFIILPFLIWAAVRLGQTVLTALLVISAVIAILGTVAGTGPFTSPSLNESLLTVEAFVSINSIMVLVLSAAILERRQNEISLRSARDNLESIVMERTKELEERNRELQRRNSELASFSYAASHDLQEPLRKIETFSDKILQTESHLSEYGKDLFRRIQRASSRMKELIENLLSYSHVDRSEKLFQETDLNLVLQVAKKELSEIITQTSAIIDSTVLPQLRVVPFQFQQLFINIISNAIKFRQPGISPHIIIEAEVVDGDTLLELNAVTGENYYHLSFADNGIGFDQQYNKKIFDIFQRLHGQTEYEGTGIGLAICKKIVDNHKGFITATGEPENGSTFHIYLPVGEVSPEENFSVARQKHSELF